MKCIRRRTKCFYWERPSECAWAFFFAARHSSFLLYWIPNLFSIRSPSAYSARARAPSPSCMLFICRLCSQSPSWWMIPIFAHGLAFNSLFDWGLCGCALGIIVLSIIVIQFLFVAACCVHPRYKEGSQMRVKQQKHSASSQKREARIQRAKCHRATEAQNKMGGKITMDIQRARTHTHIHLNQPSIALLIFNMPFIFVGPAFYQYLSVGLYNYNSVCVLAARIFIGLNVYLSRVYAQHRKHSFTQAVQWPPDKQVREAIEK